MEPEDSIFKNTSRFYDNKFIKMDSLVFHPNGWVIAGSAIEGRSCPPFFWLEIQKLGWLRFELVPEFTETAERSWLATAFHAGDCPDPNQSFSLLGVLWTRRAAIEAHQSISAYEQGLHHFSI